MKRLIELLAQATMSAALTVFFAYLIVEWAVGCGESYIDAKGIKHANECAITVTQSEQTKTTIRK